MEPAASSRLDTSKWLDDDFANAKLKNFDTMRENFIEDLTNQFSDLLMPNYQPARQNSVRVPLKQKSFGDLDKGGDDQEMRDENEEQKSPQQNADDDGAA